MFLAPSTSTPLHTTLAAAHSAEGQFVHEEQISGQWIVFCQSSEVSPPFPPGFNTLRVICITKQIILAYMWLTIDDAFVWRGLYRVNDNNGMLIYTKL
jgi:hypothetical protein